MVAGADRAELRAGFLSVVFAVRLAPGIGIVEQRVFYLLIVGSPDTERNDLVHVLNDVADPVLNAGKRRIEPHRHVATAVVETDAGDADLLFIGDYAANRLRVAEMAVRADHAGPGFADRHAVAHLGQGVFVVLAKHLERAVSI